MSTPQQITAADVVAFLKSLIPAGHPKIQVGVCTGYASGPFYASIFGDYENPVRFGATPQEAIAQVVAGIQSPKQIAAAKRAQAAKLLTEADALAPEPEEEVEREPDYDAPRPLTPLENYLQNDEHHVR